nr:TBC1 domain family 4 [Hymenolepis microstoma]
MPSPEHQSTELGREWADTRLLPTYHLNERGRKVLVALLHEIASTRPLTFYAPHVWPICAILLHYHRPRVVMECLDMIFSKCKDDRITESGKAWRSRCLAMREILLSNDPFNLPFKVANRSTVKAMKVKGRNMDPQSKDKEKTFRIEEANSWMIAVFTLPFEVMVPMIDNFITEGFKVLFRMGLVLWKEVMVNRQKTQTAIAKSGENPLLTDRSIDDFPFFVSETSKYTPETARDLLKKAFKIHQLSKRRIAAAVGRGAELANDPPANVPLADDLVKPCATPRSDVFNMYNQVQNEFKARTYGDSRPNVSKLATDEEMDFIRSQIRNRMITECMKDKLVYTSSEDGYSMQTLLSRLRAHQAKINRPEHIIIMSTLSGKGLFGAYVTSYWDPSHRTYYGDPLTVLFRLRPGPMVAYPYLGSKERRYQLCRNGEMGIGGGIDSGPCGLFFDKEMTYGQSGPSPTFNSKCLITSPDDKLGPGYIDGREDLEFCYFKIGVIEVISFVDEIDWSKVGKR